MNDTELDDELLLARARRALSPRDADEARVLQALEARLGPLGAESAKPPTSQGASASQPTPAPLQLALSTPLVKSLLGAALIGALGGTGFWLAGAERPRVEAPPPSAARQDVRAPEVTPPASAEQPSRAPEPEQPAAAPDQLAPETPHKPLKAARAPQRRTAHAALAPSALPAHDATLAARVDATSLRAELEMVARAERALRAGDARGARQLIEDFERAAQGGGKLHEERSAAKTLAECALTPARRPQLLREFEGRYPGSAYAARLRRGCALSR